MKSKRDRLLEKGEGYWCCHVAIIDDHPPPIKKSDAGIGLDDPVDFNEELVYRPVNIDQDEKGAVYGWFYSRHEDPFGATEGKRYVPLEQIYLTPPNRAEPAHKYDAKVME